MGPTLVLSLLPLAACGSPSAAGTSAAGSGSPPAWCAGATCPFQDMGLNLTAPQVSFREHLLGAQGGVFRVHCSLSSCHGLPEMAQGGLYLGPLAGTSDPPVSDALRERVHAALLAPSVAAPTLARVTPGDPKASFLMLKLDGCQHLQAGLCQRPAAAQCDNACGDPMPPGGALALEDRNLLRRWIVQGAQNN